MIRVLIVDDELPAIKVLQKLLEPHHNDISLIGSATNLEEARLMISQSNPDVVFLDIEMPGGNGFSLIENQKRNFLAVFVTAYSDHAIRAVKSNAFDYLLKPVDLDEFHVVITRIIEHFKEKQFTEYRVVLNLKDSISFARPEDILYIKGDGRYSHIFLKDGNVLSPAKNIKQFEEELLRKGFFRIHKSYLINLIHVRQFILKDGGIVEMIDGMRIDVSRRKKAEFMSLLNLDQ